MVYVLWSFRMGHGYSQKETAEKLGCEQTYISMVENGKRVPSIDFLNRWARLYDMKIHLKIGA